ncbi:histone H1.2-like [Zootoca vivipara]|uniref:histone H1.2-like n=1 Tax=Zootoca vivipara TaxID=8524 RepID=UPI00159287E6|nr:histone H1.2-like [Zootoca vivipara]
MVRGSRQGSRQGRRQGSRQGRRQGSRQGSSVLHSEAEGSSAPPSATIPEPSTSESSGRGKKRLSGPLSQLILKAFEGSSSRKGVSLAALKKFLREGGYNLNRNKNSHLKRELHKLVSNGVLIRLTGSGASGSFKHGGKALPKKSAKPETRKVKKTAAANKRPASASRDPRKKAKKQPAVSKPKGVRSSRKTAVPVRRRQLNKHSTVKGS